MMHINIEQLDNILDSGWNPPKEARVQSALAYLHSLHLTDAEQTTLINIMNTLTLKYKTQLEAQTQNLSGSGNQQDFIDAYFLAYESAKSLQQVLTLP